MIDLTAAVEVAAKGAFDATEEGLHEPVLWGELTPPAQHAYRELVLPAVAALATAGLLKETT